MGVLSKRCGGAQQMGESPEVPTDSTCTQRCQILDHLAWRYWLPTPAFMGSVVFWVGRCLPVLLNALFATTANAKTAISHLISLDVAGMMSPLHSLVAQACCLRRYWLPKPDVHGDTGCQSLLCTAIRVSKPAVYGAIGCQSPLFTQVHKRPASLVL